MGVTSDPYVLLGVAPTASRRRIEAAYRRRLRDLERSDGDTSEERRLLRLAYELLSDPVARRDYDERIAKAKARGAESGRSSGPSIPRSAEPIASATPPPHGVSGSAPNQSPNLVDERAPGSGIRCALCERPRLVIGTRCWRHATEVSRQASIDATGQMGCVVLSRPHLGCPDSIVRDDPPMCARHAAQFLSPAQPSSARHIPGARPAATAPRTRRKRLAKGVAAFTVVLAGSWGCGLLRVHFTEGDGVTAGASVPKLSAFGSTTPCKGGADLVGTKAGVAGGMVVVEIPVANLADPDEVAVRLGMSGDSSSLDLNGDDVVVNAALAERRVARVAFPKPEGARGAGVGFRTKAEVLRVGVPWRYLTDEAGYNWHVDAKSGSETVSCKSDGLIPASGA